ncbi:MAG: nucleoside hydrolase [Firmicutes bacterium]|nr:nucleoside hydrolase [Bacillota bacterium]
MKRIIFDTDNTIGLEGRPMDDALALLYLLGLPDEAEVLGITCNYGNGTVNEVYACTRKLLDEIGFNEMTVLRGSEQGEDCRSEASRWIATTVAANPGEISYIGIGSLGNLYGAYLIDNSVFDNLKEIVLMGGITEPLFIHGDQPLAELNMSINNIASECVLSKGHNISVITGNNCLPVAELPKDEFLTELHTDTSPVGMFIAQKSGYRFRDKELVYGADSSYCWDAVASAYLMHPELFHENHVPCNITADNLLTGFLNPCDEADSNAVLNIPSAIDKASLQADFYKAWLAVNISKAEISFSCNGVYLDKLIQPAILIELSKEPAHGFLLLQRLKDSGLVDQNLDPAGFYRMLKKLEKADFLVSKKTGSSPKAKQIFSVTDLGRRALNNWYDTLTHYDNHIHRILCEIDQINK